MKFPWAPPRPLTVEQEARLVAALRAAEKNNRGEVRLHLEFSRPKGASSLARARELFARLGMDKTRDDTGVLLYVALTQHSTAVYAGKGIHGATGPDFWKRVTDTVAQHAARDQLVDGLVAALALLGDQLRAHAPGEDTAGNELPDEVSTS